MADRLELHLWSPLQQPLYCLQTLLLVIFHNKTVSTAEFPFKLCLEVLDSDIKLRKALNGRNLTLRLLPWCNGNSMLIEGKHK